MQRIKLLTAKLSTGSIMSLTAATTAHAQQDPKPDNPVGDSNLAQLLTTVIDALLLFAGAVAVLFLIIGGFRYVVSAGSADQVEGAKKTILYAIVGLIIIFIAFVLVQLIQNYLGVQGDYNVNQ